MICLRFEVINRGFEHYPPLSFAFLLGIKKWVGNFFMKFVSEGGNIKWYQILDSQHIEPLET
jgi:hypothetical protein